MMEKKTLEFSRKNSSRAVRKDCRSLKKKRQSDGNSQVFDKEVTKVTSANEH